MKNLIKKSLLIATLFTAIVTMASGTDNSINFTVVNSKLIDLKLENFDGELQISVLDSKGEILHSEKYSGSTISRKYDLKTLPTGDYLFEIEGETKIKIVPFKINSNGVSLEEVESVYYKPTVRVIDDLVYISNVTFNKEALTMVLLDESSDILYNETLEGSEAIGKVLNIKELKKGSYTLYLKSGDRVFKEIVKISK